MGFSYRKVAVVLSAQAQPPQVYLGRDDDDTDNILKALLADRDARETDNCFVWRDRERNELRSLRAQVLNGAAVAFVARRPSGTVSAFLFRDPVSALHFARFFGRAADTREPTLAHVVPIVTRAEASAHEDFRWLGPPPGLSEPDIAPLVAPEGICPRCVRRPLSPNLAERVSGLCPTCTGILARLGELRARNI